MGYQCEKAGTVRNTTQSCVNIPYLVVQLTQYTTQVSCSQRATTPEQWVSVWHGCQLDDETLDTWFSWWYTESTTIDETHLWSV